MKKNILIVLILTFAVTQILHAKSFKNFYYGERVNMNKNLNNGIMQSIYILENHNFISIGFDYSLTNEERSRDFYNNYNDWSGRNVYASQKNNYFSLNHILAQYNKFGVSYEKEQDCDYSFTEKIFDLNNNLLKTNARQSDGDIYSLNLFYTFTFNLSTKYNFKIQPLLSYKKFENKILMFEDFQSASFDDYKLCGYFDGDGISSKCSINFESQNKKNKYILSYQFPTRFSGDYYISDNTTGNSVSISTKKITMPAELGITAILIMPSEHFTKLIFNIIYTNWQNLKDNEGFQISSAPQNLKNTISAAAGLTFKTSNKLTNNLTLFYEPSYYKTSDKKIGLNIGTNIKASAKLNIFSNITIAQFKYIEDYPFTLQADGTRSQIYGNDYSNNKDIKFSIGMDYKL